jgi:hypothetical protein
VVEIIFINIFLFYKKLVKQCSIVVKNDVLNFDSSPTLLIPFPRECIGPTGVPGMFLGNISF